MDGRLPERPSALREALTQHAADGLVAGVAEAGRRDPGRRRRRPAPQAPEWLALRGSVHQLLASRGSRIALYDLRETLERSSAPLPVSFLSALHTIGDRACLEPLAEAFAHAPEREAWWRQQLASAFQAIMAREKLTVRQRGGEEDRSPMARDRWVAEHVTIERPLLQTRSREGGAARSALCAG